VRGLLVARQVTQVGIRFSAALLRANAAVAAVRRALVLHKMTPARERLVALRACEPVRHAVRCLPVAHEVRLRHEPHAAALARAGEDARELELLLVHHRRVPVLLRERAQRLDSVACHLVGHLRHLLHPRSRASNSCLPTS